MKGSEKQIKWAEDIKANIIRVYEGAKAANAGNAAAAEQFDAAIDKINSIEDAGLIIDLYHLAKFNGDLQHDFAQIAATHHNMSAYERSLVIPE